MGVKKIKPEFTKEQKDYIQENFINKAEYRNLEKELNLYKTATREKVNIIRLQSICGRGFLPQQIKAIEQWGKTFEDNVRAELVRIMEDEYKRYLLYSIDIFIIAIAFVLHFNEKTRFGQKRLNDVLHDITETVDLFNHGEYSPKDYVRMLEKDGIKLKKTTD